MNEFKRTPIQKRVSPESLLHPLTPSTKPSRFRAASADASEKSGLTTRVTSLLSVEYGKSRRLLHSVCDNKIFVFFAKGILKLWIIKTLPPNWYRSIVTKSVDWPSVTSSCDVCSVRRRQVRVWELKEREWQAKSWHMCMQSDTSIASRLTWESEYDSVSCCAVQ